MTSKPYNPFTTYIDLTKFVTSGTNSRDVGNSPRDVQEFQSPNTQMMKMNKFSSDAIQVNPISPCEPSGLDSRPIIEPFIWEQSLRSRGISNSSEDSEGSPKSYPTDYGCGSLGAAGGMEQQNFEAAGGNYNLSEVAQLVQQMVHQEIRSSRYRMGCVFCKKNGETYEYYSTHVLKDNRGKVVCPILRKYTCPSCQATGDSAHTQRHCPLLNGKVFGK